MGHGRNEWRCCARAFPSCPVHSFRCTTQIPETRVARLGDTALRALTLAAVVGREFDLTLVGRVGEFAEDEDRVISDRRPAIDVLRVVVGGQLLAVAAILVFRRRLKRR